MPQIISFTPNVILKIRPMLNNLASQILNGCTSSAIIRVRQFGVQAIRLQVGVLSSLIVMRLHKRPILLRVGGYMGLQNQDQFTHVSMLQTGRPNDFAI